MSLKINAFTTTLPAPKTLDKFVVILPYLPHSLFRVSATSLPYSGHGEGVIWLFGRQFVIPVDKQSTGDWSCTLLEDIALTGAMSISTLQQLISNKEFKPGDVKIAITDQITGAVPQLLVTLKNAWIKSISPVNLDWMSAEQSLQYNVTFKYNGIKRWY